MEKFTVEWHCNGFDYELKLPTPIGVMNLEKSIL